MLQQRIRQFWDWFTQNEHLFKEVTDRDRVIEMLNDQILEFGFFSWEIGPGRNEEYALTISPNGDGRRLQISKQIVQEAPLIAGWEFYYCKPPKDWDFTFEMYDRSMIKQQFDASDWEFIIREDRQQRDKMEILLFAHNLFRVDRDDLPAVADLVINNVLGEEIKINFVQNLDLLEEIPVELEGRSRKLPELRASFAYFL